MGADLLSIGSAHKDILAPALWYAKHGYRVFPIHNPDLDGKPSCSCGKQDCASKAKHPRTEHGVKDATTDERQIRDWWTRWPKANVGIACGDGLLVLDVDRRAGGDTSLRLLCDKHCQLPETPVVLTGGGGQHYYFRVSSDVKLRNSASALGLGLDIKSDGGYVVAPPSMHISLVRYEWERSSRLNDVEIAAAPLWLLHLISHSHRNREKQRFEIAGEIAPGQRNDTLFRLARSLKTKQLSYDEIFVALLAVNASRCKPPLSEREVEQIARNAVDEPYRSDFEPRDNPWLNAKSASDFITEGTAEVDYVARDLLVRNGVTIWASPRGLGKTQAALALAVAAASGKQFRAERLNLMRVLYLDRDNPSSDLRRRFNRWRANQAQTLKVLDRTKCPPLTDTKAWSHFPFSDYDLVVIDSWSAATEGIKEKEAGEAGKAMAAVLDNARKGPSILLLANCRKDEGVLRGSGVIGDRADIIYEIRDATDLKLEAKHEHWLDALRLADETQWAAKSKRRRRRESYRLAFVPSKFRVGEEPDPFIIEIRLPDDSDWSVIDITHQVEDELNELKGQATEARRETEAAAIEALAQAIAERYAAGSPLSAKDAVEILHAAGLSRDHARHVRDDLAVGIAARWRRVRADDSRKSWFLPLSSAASDSHQSYTERNTSVQPDAAGVRAQYPPHFASTKAHVQNDFDDSEMLRTQSVNTQDRERI